MTHLTGMERRALLGTQALSREMHQRQAQEREETQQDFLALLREIALAHELPEAAFDGEYGINLSTMEIVPTAPPEEITPAIEDASVVVERS